MLTLESHVWVPGLSGEEIAAFMLDCDDDRYQAWWPGTHLQFHLLAPGDGADHRGDVVLMDEYVGTRRLRMTAEVVDVFPGRRIVWRMRYRRIRLPAWVRLDLLDHDGGVTVVHTVGAGWGGAGRLLDPLLRLFLSSEFAAAMDRHARTEFSRLPALLRPSPQ